MKNLFLGLAIILNSNLAFSESDQTLQIGKFSTGNMNQWKNKIFSGSTNYQIVKLNNDRVLKAESHSGASGLFKEQRIDLLKTPYLNWRWRIDNRLGKIDEQNKSGDDYSARLYVVVDGGWAFWKTKAINYVWASNTAKNTVWSNAFAGSNAMMIAIRSTDDKTGTWYQEKRNIFLDLKQQFGSDIRYIDAVALMTDTDNAKGNAISYYGDIYFSEK
ncbi:MAG: DUF3047 domain-containing protein [Methylococcaceae bacterium]|nr:DUF3047 domain-containing protein [Methylococcaceae bacterium]